MLLPLGLMPKNEGWQAFQDLRWFERGVQPYGCSDACTLDEATGFKDKRSA
ncbi:MAG: hypothetical protein WCC57_14540 [Paracoccaceae bacterium]